MNRRKSSESIAKTFRLPLVSIIMPCYNREHLLETTLKSVWRLEYRPIELILVDDGSTDKSVRIIENFQNNYQTHNFKVIIREQKHRGAPAARNLGLKLAKGDYIQYLDSDDSLDPKKISLQIKIAENTESDIVVCDYKKVFSEGTEEHFLNFNPKQKMTRGGSVAIFTPLIRAHLAKSIFWNGKLEKNQDVDYMLKLFLITKRIHYLNLPLCVYNIHEKGQIRDTYGKLKNTELARICSLVNFLFSTRKAWKVHVLGNATKALIFLLYKDCRRNVRSQIRAIATLYRKKTGYE